MQLHINLIITNFPNPLEGGLCNLPCVYFELSSIYHYSSIKNAFLIRQFTHIKKCVHFLWICRWTPAVCWVLPFQLLHPHCSPVVESESIVVQLLQWPLRQQQDAQTTIKCSWWHAKINAPVVKLSERCSIIFACKMLTRMTAALMEKW